MDELTRKSESRRRFLLAGGRWLGLGGLAAYAAGQELKRRRLADDPNCLKLQTCADCLEFGRCAKPKAQRFRVSQDRPGSDPKS